MTELILAILTVILIILQIADYETTNTALTLGLNETNPLMRILQKQIGPHWYLAKIVVMAIIILAVANLPFIYSLSMLIALDIIFGFIVWRNEKLIRKHTIIV